MNKLDSYLAGDADISINGNPISYNEAISIYKNPDSFDADIVNDVNNNLPQDLKEFADALPYDIEPGQSLQHALLEYINGPLLKSNLSSFIEYKDQHFNDDALNDISSKVGTVGYQEALKDSLDRMSGKQGRGADATTSKWQEWLQNSVGTIMFLNFRSAGLQFLSTWNFMSPNNFLGFHKDLAAIAVKGSQQNKLFKELWNDPMMKERRARAGFDVNAEEIIQHINDPSKFTAKMLNKGFILTSLMDSVAIASGGTAYINQKTKQGVSKENALKSWRRKTQEAQQSARPDRVSQQQKASVSKLILAFANTPAQYFRLSQKAYRVIKSKGITSPEGMKAARQIAYYMAIQNAIFTMAQSASTALLMGWGGDDEERKQAENSLNSMTDTWLRGMGLLGAVASAAKNATINAYRESNKARPDYGKGILKGAVGVAPPLSRKINDIQAIGNAYKYNEESGLRGAHAVAAGRAGAAALNVPSDWLQKKLAAAQALYEGDADFVEFLQMFGGYSEYSVLGPGKKDGFDEGGFDEGGFGDEGFDSETF